MSFSYLFISPNRSKNGAKVQKNPHKNNNFAFFYVFFAKICKKICTYQKKVVPLHPLLKNKSVLCPIEGHAPLLNGVMVALQILVLSVWVRVLVEQHRRDLMGLFLVVIPTQTQVLSPQGARLLLRNLRVLVEQHRRDLLSLFLILSQSL